MLCKTHTHTHKQTKKQTKNHNNNKKTFILNPSCVLISPIYPYSQPIRYPIHRFNMSACRVVRRFPRKADQASSCYLACTHSTLSKTIQTVVGHDKVPLLRFAHGVLTLHRTPEKSRRRPLLAALALSMSVKFNSTDERSSQLTDLVKKNRASTSKP